MFQQAYELARAGDPLGAARECESEFGRDYSFVSAVEGSDFFVLARAPGEALRFAREVDRRLAFFQARLEFFRGLALWDQGQSDGAMAAFDRAVSLGDDNAERLQLELSARISPEAIQRLLKSMRP